MNNQTRNHLNLQKHIADQDHIIRVRNTEIAALRKRAEKAERERDEWKDSAIKAMADLERAEQPRPLTPDDAMVLRALNADMWEEHKVGPWGSLDSFRTPAVDAMRAVLTAALTVPMRPEGAEEIEAYMRELVASHPEDHYGELADHLASRGVLPPLTDKTHPEETP